MSGLGLALKGINLAATAAGEKSALGKVPKQVWEALAVIGYAFALIALHQHYAHAAIAAAKAEQKVADQTALDQTVANYRAAAAKAAAGDKANAQRVQAESQANNKERDDAYQARIADARATAQRLRDQLAQAAANPGSSGSASVSGISAPAGGPAQASGDDGLSISERLTATEQAIQLDELIKWVKKEAGIDVNGQHPAPK